MLYFVAGLSENENSEQGQLGAGCAWRYEEGTLLCPAAAGVAQADVEASYDAACGSADGAQHIGNICESV